ncbi:hypothetical protein EVJ58_g7234 [Rhodofomes roseus]|uniref:Uncharacterized protein n=1 Tax=Rhodofomes roseus TaxID=34475 RepID=A0A4Y9Y8D5_9APHY|nr:hypothetical protein EVJ58_g7234 [Rhodofomes roseus]
MPVPAPATQKPNKRWLTAEEEKARLFESAQAAVARAQGLDGSITSSPPESLHGRSDSITSNSPMSSQQARAQEPTAGPAPRTPPPAQGSSGGYRSSPQTPPSARGRMPTYLTADEEKAAMRRFYEAKAAVDRTQEVAFGVSPSTPASGPMPYDALYPSTPASPPTIGGSPPPFASSASSSQPAYLSEKERLRRDYEARDAAAMASPPPVPPPHSMLPPMSAVGSPAYQPPAPVTTIPPPAAAMSSAAAEKEMLRRRFEAQDAAVYGSNGPPAPPPRSGSFSAGSRALPASSRSPPVPPVSGSGSRPLTAAEEKARLKAMYEAEDRVAKPPNGVISHPASSVTPLANGAAHYAAPVAPPPPPPLAPKPPKEYIQETQEEDMRTHARLQAIDKEISATAPLKTEVILSSFSADLVDASGNPMPPPGPPPPIAQPTSMPVEIE